MDHTDQLQRIRTKLAAARKSDPDFKVFGAGSHQYRIGPPASEKDVRAFEERHSIKLPACYRSFLTSIGNGRHSHRKSAAGPYYGIYPLGKHLDEIAATPAGFLRRPAILHPAMTDEEWSQETEPRNSDEIPAGEREEGFDRIYGGLLPLGSQGCTYLHVLVLNGPHAGRVVNLNLDGEKPKFAFERTFLDWYERWLDEVIHGYLSQDGPAWFGYTMAGDDQRLMEIYAGAGDRQTQLEALEGLAKLDVVSEATCQKLLELSADADMTIRHQALLMLAKFAYSMARQPLRSHIMGDDGDCLVACQGIYWYARAESKEWIDLLRNRLPTVNSPESFRFLSYLLVNSGADFSEDLRPLCTHPEEDIRSQVFYSLGKLANKRHLVDLFLLGLDDPCPSVVHTTLQALKGVQDERLAAAYDRVRDRFKTDEHYILTNLQLRMKEMRGGILTRFLKRLRG